MIAVKGAGAYRWGIVATVALVLRVGPSAAVCPPSAEILQRLDAVHLERSSRTVRFSVAVPDDLYRQAATQVGRPVTARQGKQGLGVLVAELGVERLWRALNDEDHFAAYLPVEHSEVIAGVPRGESRLLFQYFKRWGIGRWWVSRVEMNQALWRESEGNLWEIFWTDVMDGFDPAGTPVAEVSSELAPIDRTEGAWLLVPIGDTCTTVEYFTLSEPGGVIGATQWLMARRVIRNTMNGILQMAAEHDFSPAPAFPFQRPDGRPLEGGGP